MSFCDYLEALLLNAICNDIPFSAPALYAGLWTGDPGELGAGGIEASGAGYARVSAYGKWGIPGGDPMAIANSTAIVFPEATAVGGWGTVDYFGLLDSPTGGFMLVYGLLLDPKIITKGSIPRFDIGSLIVFLD